MLQSILNSLFLPDLYLSIMNVILRERTYPSTVNIHLVQGDITKADVEGVVNPANQYLKHGGGLAGLLAKKAGPLLQKESDRWIKEKGAVSHQSPAYTGAGELPFRYIIHAVGPVWGSGNEEAKLRAAVDGSITVANQLGLRSLALPAISTGIFGYPLENASQVIIIALHEYALSDEKKQIFSLQIVLFDQQAADVFQTSWDQLMR
jgi:O-acetyl-ADP-ribose deacetylase (regulator of RNase III)